MRTYRLPAILAAAALLFTVVSAQRKDPGAFDREKKFYDMTLGVGALMRRADGIYALARTADNRAVAVLTARYAKAEEPGNQIKYLVAGALGETRRVMIDAKGAQEIWTFAKAQHKDLDAWLTYNALTVDIATNGIAVALEVQNARGVTAFERAAAIEALAISGKREVLAQVLALADAKAANALERRLALSCCASALLYLSAHLKEKDYIAAARAVINQLDNAKLGDDVKLIIARHLARVFKVDKFWINADPWLRLLDDKPAVEEKGATVAKRPTFFGLEGRGKRIVYVIDWSDSMLEPLKGEEIDEIKKRVVTDGPGDKPDEKDPGLPWDKIKNRFDAAREVLKLSLRHLPDDVVFAVVAFGTEAKPLNSTKRFVDAKAGNIGAVIAELDSIKPGPVGPERPYGTLMGSTNLHGGVARAFRMTAAGLINDDDEHVNKNTFTSGCDTIFVLSDGEPNVDDYPGMGELITGVGGTTDREKGTSKTNGQVGQGRMQYMGPYAQRYHLLRDIRRMNLFRKAEINCVGVGEADNSLLEAISGLGLGTLVTIGKKSKTVKADPPELTPPDKADVGPLIGPDDRRPSGQK